MLIYINRLLIQLVEEYGVRKWSHIAQMLAGRIGKQCRERWHNHLRPDIKVSYISAFFNIYVHIKDLYISFCIYMCILWFTAERYVE